MKQKPLRVLIITLLVILVGVLAMAFLQGDSAVDPNRDSLLSPDEGKKYAAIYNFDEIYSRIEENDSILRYIQNDLLLFAQTTSKKLYETPGLIGFTFDKDFSVAGDTIIFTGYFYGLDNRIEVKLTPHGRGVNTLSITNMVTGDNIDEELSLNGKRNRFIQKLPIEKEGYSIRYLLREDIVIVTFYEPYTLQDVDEVTRLIEEGFGNTSTNDVRFIISSRGAYSLERIREHLKNPIRFSN